VLATGGGAMSVPMDSGADKPVRSTSLDRGAALMLACQQGDQQAFDTIVEEYSSAVFGILRRVLGANPAVEDLAQESFLRLYRARDRYRPEGKLTTFLFRIAYNLALNHIRGSKRRSEVGMPRNQEGEGIELEDSKSELPAAAPDRGDWAALVDWALQQLPENQRAAMVFQHYDGLDLNEIGESLGISEKAAKSLCHRARAKMRDILAPYKEAEND
jgi:RNA polymerase sigma-70 factor (ECF subfamily)